MKMKFKYFSFFLILVFFTLATSCKSNTKIIEGIVGVVNNEIILLTELDNHIIQSQKNTNLDKDKNQFLKELMDLKILEIQGKKMGIIVTNEKLEEIISEIIKNNGEEKFNEELTKSNRNLYRLKFELTIQMLQENISRIVLKNKIIISEKEIEKYYEKNIGSIKKQNLIKMLSMSAKDKEFIDEILDIFNNREDTLDVKLAKLVERGYIKDKPKDLGYVNPKELSSTIYDEIINSKIGEVVGPIKIQDEASFFIILDKTYSDASFLLAREDIKNTIYKNKSIKLLDSWFSDLRKSMYISQRL
ncbi:hypothetical protein CM15mP43_03940 [bacterium]|nr:MAG: hypothetical protein CM15mP43_03940 [bacterium]